MKINISHLFLKLSDQFVVLLEQFLGHFDLELLAGRIFDLQTVVAGIGHIGELEVVLDLAQFATREDAHEDLLVGGQFLDVDLGILGHYGELLGEGGQSAIVIQQQDHLIGFGVNEAVERTKLLRSWKLLHG